MNKTKLEYLERCRINAFISQTNYKLIDELIENKSLYGMKLTKGTVLDLALTSLFTSLESGESLENIALNLNEKTSNDKSLFEASLLSMEVNKYLDNPVKTLEDNDKEYKSISENNKIQLYQNDKLSFICRIKEESS